MSTESTCETRAVKLWPSLAIVVGLEFLFVVGVGAIFGKMILEKVVTDLVMPPGLLFLGMTTAIVHGVRSRAGNVSIFLLACVWSLLAISSNGIFANWLMSTLEKKYADIDPSASGPLDVVILLGGSTEDSPSGAAQVNANGDRLVQAAALYHQGVAKSIVCTGAAIAGLRGTAEADQARALLIRLGVPEAAIKVMKGRNTYEEVQTIRDELPAGAKLGVITSAWHMARVMRLARKANVELQPLPADFRHESMRDWGGARWIRECIPNRDAIGLTTAAATEYLASLVSR